MTQHYEAKSFNLNKLQGISNKTMELHIQLYEGYVKEANILAEKVESFLKDGEVVSEDMAAYAEAKRRLGYEFNGMKLHEYYFENLKNNNGEATKPGPLFMEKAILSFGSYEAWQDDFITIGKMRGVGWAICCAHPSSGRLFNHWIFLHDLESLAGLQPMLVMDVWEHAFLFDYQPTERQKYIEDFFSNINWAQVDDRCKKGI